FCIVDDYLKAIDFRDDCQAKMNSAEIMTITVAAAVFFAGNHEKARIFFKDHRYMRFMLSKSQFNRRLRSIPVFIWKNLQKLLAQVLISHNLNKRVCRGQFSCSCVSQY